MTLTSTTRNDEKNRSFWTLLLLIPLAALAAYYLIQVDNSSSPGVLVTLPASGSGGVKEEDRPSPLGTSNLQIFRFHCQISFHVKRSQDSSRYYTLASSFHIRMAFFSSSSIACSDISLTMVSSSMLHRRARILSLPEASSNTTTSTPPSTRSSSRPRPSSSAASPAWSGRAGGPGPGSTS